MKGPFERLKYDLRRVWECPVCKRRERTPGTVTFRHCLCQMKQLDGRAAVMQLVADGVQRLGPAIVIRVPEAAGTPMPMEAGEVSAEPSSGMSDVPASDTVNEYRNSESN